MAVVSCSPEGLVLELSSRRKEPCQLYCPITQAPSHPFTRESAHVFTPSVFTEDQLCAPHDAELLERAVNGKCGSLLMTWKALRRDRCGPNHCK